VDPAEWLQVFEIWVVREVVRKGAALVSTDLRDHYDATYLFHRFVIFWSDAVEEASNLDSEVADAFRLFDTDKNGKVTRAEIESLVSTLGGETDCPHVQDLLKASDEQGSVDLPSFMKLWQKFKESVSEDGDDSEEEIKNAFKDYDADGDGYITRDEMVKVITNMGFVSNKEEEVTKCLREMDLDGDGRVSYAEFMVKWKIT